jgi:positive regulator of sigma E activity
LGRAKGPSVVGKVLLAFLLPLLVFIGSLMLAGYLLSGYMSEGGGKTILSFSAALLVTVVLVQFIRKFTGKPVNEVTK